jgi:hypothetical protein
MELGALFMDEERSVSSHYLSFDLSHHPFECETIYIENIPKEPTIKIEEPSVYSSDVSTQSISSGFADNVFSTKHDDNRDLVESMGEVTLVCLVIVFVMCIIYC